MILIRHSRTQGLCKFLLVDSFIKHIYSNFEEILIQHLKVTEDINDGANQHSRHDFLLAVCGNHVYMLHHVQQMTPTQYLGSTDREWLAFAVSSLHRTAQDPAHEAVTAEHC